MSDWLDAESHADRALEMYERGRWAEAEAELRKAISLNPDHAEWHFNLGLTLEASGRDVEALGCYERAIDLMPDQVEPLVAAATIANRLNKPDKALAWLEAALRMDNRCEDAYAAKIESHLRRGEHDEAETTFYLAQQALDEPSARCLAVMAESLIQRQVWERAQWCLKETLRLEPSMPRVRARLAGVLAAMGKPERALQLFLNELRDDPGNIDTLLDLGDLLLNLDRLPEAAEKLRRVLELEPANVDAHFRMGQIALAAKRFEQAHLEFELVLKLDPNYPEARVALGEALLNLGRTDDARQHLLYEFDLFKAALAEDAALLAAGEPLSPPLPEELPADARAESNEQLFVKSLSRLARLLLDSGEPARAATLYTAVLAVQETPDILRQLALARFRSGDRSGGIAASRRVLRLEPGCVQSIHNMALAAFEQKQFNVAAEWVKRGLKLSRHDAELRRLRMHVWIAQLRRLIRRIARLEN
jgi:tetratricopeptide (TPR) repeat protein